MNFYFYKENPLNRLKIENIASFSMSPVSKCVAVHVSGKKVIIKTIKEIESLGGF